ncbi:hypothetical protein BKA70DRAFT_1369233 [Coprinopsis sp. MPI-PUGE-AT-0042]|nr:hypothetical protein BKA70DRAFT_1369233 [Coprinopsis sp. MPI-PUGE-AT-0042]
MPIPTAPALLIGIGARILIDIANRANTGQLPRLHDTILVGVWQGVALQFAGKNVVALAIIGLSILVKIVTDFSTIPDATRAIATIVGVALGMVGTDLLSSFVDQAFEAEQGSSSKGRSSSSRKHVSSHGHHRELKRQPSSRPLPRTEPRERLVQWHASVQGGSVTTEPLQSSDITSVDGIISQKARNMTPLEQEIAALRAKASLADSERRRCREERKWAQSQGNEELAGELKANYKRFKALMEECHKEADAKLLESAKVKNSYEYRDNPNFSTRQQPSSSRPQPSVPSHLRSELARTLRNPRLPPLSTSSSSAAPERPPPPHRTRKVSASKPSPRNPKK